MPEKILAGKQHQVSSGSLDLGFRSKGLHAAAIEMVIRYIDSNDADVE